MPEELGLFEGGGPHDDAIRAQLEQLSSAFHGAHPAPDLDWDFPGGPQDVPNEGIVGSATIPRRVEIHDVQSLGPLGTESSGHRDRVRVEDHLAAVVALLQANQSAPAQVDSRDYLHAELAPPSSRISSRAP